MGLCSLPLICLGPNCDGGYEDNGDLLQKVPCMHCYTRCPSPAAGHHRPVPLPETPGHLWASLGDLLQEALCHTQVCCTQVPCPCGSPLLTCTSTADTQTEFCLSLCGVSGSWCTQSLFEPSEHFWQIWGLILNVISPLLPSYWGFSFVHLSPKHLPHPA